MEIYDRKKKIYIENMYLNFSGNEYDFTECLLDTGVVDIRN